MAQSILYYPTINIEDGAWLRSALLYWDEINSIVPYKNYMNLSPELLFLEKCGHYKPLYPEEIFVLGNPSEFALAVKRFFRHELLHSRHGVDMQMLTEQIYSPDLSSLVHYNKIPIEILELLTKHEQIRLKDNGWIEMSYDFAMKYMRLLAEFAATHCLKDTVIGTNLMGRISEIYPKGFKGSDSHVVTILLEKCLPIPTMDVGLEDLIYFKEHHKDDFLELRYKIRELEKSISESENVVQLKSTMATFKEKWEHELACVEKMFRGRKIKFVLGSLRSFVTDAGAVAGLAQWAQDSGVLDIPRTAIGAAIGVTGLVGIGAYTIRYKEQLRAMNAGNNFAYIISAKREGLLRRTNSIEVI